MTDHLFVAARQPLGYGQVPPDGACCFYGSTSASSGLGVSGPGREEPSLEMTRQFICALGRCLNLWWSSVFVIVVAKLAERGWSLKLRPLSYAIELVRWSDAQHAVLQSMYLSAITAMTPYCYYSQATSVTKQSSYSSYS